MLEQGIVMLVNALSSPPETGGYFVELPKDTLRGWTYRSVSETEDTGLVTPNGLRMMRLQIDCYGTAAADVISDARDIDIVLQGFAGTLPDPDSTFVSACWRSDRMDFFQDAPRSYRRMLEYEILYAQS